MPTNPTHQHPDLDPPSETPTPPLASNSLPLTPHSGGHPHPRSLSDVLGIDHLTLKPPIERPQSKRWEGESTHRRPTSKKVHRRLNAEIEPYADFKIKLRSYTVPDQGWRASISFNPSHHPASTDPWAACPLEVLEEVLDDVWRTVEHLITPLTCLRGAPVDRVDLTRDFKVAESHQRSLIRGWTSYEVPRATSRPVWHSPMGVPTNFSTGTKKRGLVRAYDHALKHGSPPDTFRAEVEAREHWARTYGRISVVDDICPATVEALFLDRFRYAGLHLPVTHDDARLDRLLALAAGPDPCLTLGQLPRLVGYERLVAHGVVLPEGHTTRSQRRKVTDRVGLPHREHDAPQTIRLDPHYDELLVLTA